MSLAELRRVKDELEAEKARMDAALAAGKGRRSRLTWAVAGAWLFAAAAWAVALLLLLPRAP